MPIFWMIVFSIAAALLFTVVIGLVFVIDGVVSIRAEAHKHKAKTNIIIGTLMIGIPLLLAACVATSIAVHEAQEKREREFINNNSIKIVVRNNDYERAEELLQSGVHPDHNQYSIYQKSNYYEPGFTTPLIAAIINGNYELAELLLEYGADPDLCGDGTSPVAYAVTRDRWEILQLLIDHGADISEPSLLISSVIDEHTECVRVLLENGADPNAKHTNGYSALYLARKKDKIRELLLKYGAEYGPEDHQ